MPRIMIVEDQEVILDNLAKIMQMSGLDVIQCPNGLLAKQTLNQSIEKKLPLPKLIISDLAMPLFDGFELLQYIRSQEATAKIPFVILSARSDVNDLRKAFALGANDYLVKPFEVDELMNLIGAMLKGAPRGSNSLLASFTEADIDFQLE